ncbi:MAG: ABC transporter ATP-binding protein [Verrucomicrobia bacterium]|nr:ABC transporter ATP-binding protein [Verrucomicrobiota bacterium]
MLKVVHLVSGYGALRVITGVSLHVARGEVVTLIGANGSGKSTLLKTVAGLISPREGRVLLKGREMAGQPANAVAAAGLTLVPEGRGLFPGMSVLENLRMGGYARGLGGRRLAERIDTVCAGFPALLERFEQRAGSLSGGQQQILALARALVGAPEVLLLDEPSTGLAPLLVAEVFAKIMELKRSGVTIILAEQNVRQALQVADRAYVMKTGRVVMEGPSSEVAEADEVRQAYLGM